MKKKPDSVMDIKELSAYLKIPKTTLYRLAREGKIPRQKIGRHWRFRKEAIDRWLENLPAKTSAQAGTHRNSEEGGKEEWRIRSSGRLVTRKPRSAATYTLR